MATKASGGAKKVDAQKNEAQGSKAVVKLRDVEFEVPNAMDLPWTFLKAARENDESELLRLALGDEQYEKFCSLNPTIREGIDFLSNVVEATGLDSLGN